MWKLTMKTVEQCEDAREMCEICSKLTIKTLKQCLICLKVTIKLVEQS